MLKIFFALLILALTSNALEEMGLKGGGCILTPKKGIVVNFEAYKTPLKIGVSGTFDKFLYIPNLPSGKNFREIFVGSSVLIDTSSVNSQNKGRDNKLVKFFFDKMVSTSIEAKIVDYKPNKRYKGKPKTGLFMVKITMNGVTKTIPMKYSYSKGKMQAKGVIDIFDFSANKSLQELNRACYKLHKGKTWNDVSISFITEVEATLCYSH